MKTKTTYLFLKIEHPLDISAGILSARVKTLVEDLVLCTCTVLHAKIEEAPRGKKAHRPSR